MKPIAMTEAEEAQAREWDARLAGTALGPTSGSQYQRRLLLAEVDALRFALSKADDMRTAIAQMIMFAIAVGEAVADAHPTTQREAPERLHRLGLAMGAAKRSVDAYNAVLAGHLRPVPAECPECESLRSAVTVIANRMPHADWASALRTLIRGAQ